MASQDINVVTLVGNLTKDPDLKETGSGTAVCELRLANNTTVKKDGEWESKPNYFQVNVWGRQAENCEKYLGKGDRIAILGRLEWQKWQDKNDPEKTNSRVVVVANQVQFLVTKKAGKKEESEDIPF